MGLDNVRPELQTPNKMNRNLNEPRNNMESGNVQEASNRYPTGKEEMSGLNDLKKEETAIEYCERVHPKTCEEFKKITDEMYETFCKKQRNYGPSNISVGVSDLTDPEDIKVSLTGLFFRMNDKIQRIKQLVVKSQPDEVGESVDDTFLDLSVYGIIAQIVQRGKWGK